MLTLLKNTHLKNSISPLGHDHTFLGGSILESSRTSIRRLTAFQKFQLVQFNISAADKVITASILAGIPILTQDTFFGI